MFKKLLCAIALVILFSVPVNASATEEVSFSLSDVSCDKNRIFQTELCASNEVAAFVASLTYDENALEFREAKAVDGSAEISVNSNVQGKIKIAYLCKEGATGELVTISFKSKDASTHINLTVEQVIDTDAKDITASVKGADITLNVGTTQSINKENSEESTTATTSDTAKISSSQSNELKIEILPKDSFDLTLVICIVGGVLVLSAVAAVAFFLGKKSSEK